VAAGNVDGYIRFPEAAGTLTPPENPAKAGCGSHGIIWPWLEGARLGRGGRPVAPFYIDLEQPVRAERGVPKPGRFRSSQGRSPAIRHHWFGLAGAVLIAFGVWVSGQRRG